MIKQAILAATLVVGATVSANAVPVTLFEDNFNTEGQGTNQVLDKWTVTDGSVDVIPVGSQFNWYPTQGNYLDMDGSTGAAGTIATNATFNLVAGREYVLTFRYGVNQNSGGTEFLKFGLGTLTAPSLVIAFSNATTMLEHTYTFISATNLSNVSLFFGGVGSDNSGAILDDVKLSAVPLPAAAPLFLMGLAGLGAMARRRRAKVSV